LLKANYSDGGHRFVGSSCVLKCPEQFNLRGSQKLDCLVFNETHGRWDVDTPTCEPFPTEAAAISAQVRSATVSGVLVLLMMAIIVAFF
jgi:hypothetical protein